MSTCLAVPFYVVDVETRCSEASCRCDFCCRARRQFVLCVGCKSREWSRRMLKRMGSECRKEFFESSSFGMNTASNSRTLTAYSTYHGLVVGYVVQEVVE